MAGALAATAAAGAASAQDAASETLVEGLDFPAGIAFTSDGRMLVTERAGRVRLIEQGRLEPDPVAEIPVTTKGETGLLGIAVEPGDEAAFVFATEPDGASNTIWRIPLDPPGEPERTITDLPAAKYHNGGGVAFDSSGMLLVSNGEQHSTDRSQNPEVLGGKVYRFTPAGGIPDDNPFGNSPALAIGLRNPYGLTVDPVTGVAWVTENGPAAWDEINRVIPGGNHGWPVISGPVEKGARGLGSFGPGDYQDPQLAFEEIIVPTGIVLAGDNAAPEYRDSLFFAAYRDSTIRRATLDEDREQIESDGVLLRTDAPVVALAWGPDGLYYSTNEGAVKVVKMTERPTLSPSPSEASTDPSPSPSPTVEPAVEEAQETRTWWPVLALAGAAAVGGALWVRARSRQ